MDSLTENQPAADLRTLTECDGDHSLCGRMHSPEERPEYHSALWLYEFERLMWRTMAKPDSDSAHEIRKKIRQCLALDLDRFRGVPNANYDTEQFRYLVYYSTVVPPIGAPASATSGREEFFNRILCTPFDNPGARNSWQQKAEASASGFVKHTPLFGALEAGSDGILEAFQFKGESRKYVLEKKGEIRAHRLFSLILQSTPCAPVNLTEATSTDHHLTQEVYAGIIDEAMSAEFGEPPPEFAPAPSPAKTKRRNWGMKKLEWWLRTKKLVAVSGVFSLFDKSCVARASGWSEELQKRIRAQAEARELADLVKQAACEIRFCFPKTLPRRKNSAFVRLREITAKLLVGPLGDAKLLERLLAGEEITLGEMFPTLGTEDVRNPAANVRLADSHCPSLPFFLTALLFDGQYRDLMGYIMPAFLLDMTELKISTVDRSQNLDDLLLVVGGHSSGAISPAQESDFTRMDRVLSRLISENGFGQFVFLNRGAPIVQTRELTCDKSFQREKCLVRNTFIPLRQLERLCQTRYQEEHTRKLKIKLFHELSGKLLGSIVPLIGESTEAVLDKCLNLEVQKRDSKPPDAFDLGVAKRRWLAAKAAIPWFYIYLSRLEKAFNHKGERFAGELSDVAGAVSLHVCLELIVEWSGDKNRRFLEKALAKNVLECPKLAQWFEYPRETISLIMQSLLGNVNRHGEGKLVDKARFWIENTDEETWFFLRLGNKINSSDTPGTGVGTEIVKELCCAAFGPEGIDWRHSPEKSPDSSAQSGERFDVLMSFRLATSPKKAITA